MTKPKQLRNGRRKTSLRALKDLDKLSAQQDVIIDALRVAYGGEIPEITGIKQELYLSREGALDRLRRLIQEYHRTDGGYPPAVSFPNSHSAAAPIACARSTPSATTKTRRQKPMPEAIRARFPSRSALYQLHSWIGKSAILVPPIAGTVRRDPASVKGFLMVSRG